MRKWIPYYLFVVKAQQTIFLLLSRHSAASTFKRGQNYLKCFFPNNSTISSQPSSHCFIFALVSSAQLHLPKTFNIEQRPRAYHSICLKQNRGQPILSPLCSLVCITKLIPGTLALWVLKGEVKSRLSLRTASFFFFGNFFLIIVQNCILMNVKPWQCRRVSWLLSPPPNSWKGLGIL